MSEIKSRKIIALTGKAGSGKSTAADFFVSKGFVKLSFATPLKEDMLYIQKKYGLLQNKNRPFLQWLGCHLRSIGHEQNVEDPIIGKMRVAIEEHFNENIVIDDLRLPIEFEFCKNFGAECYRICGREYDASRMSGGSKQHITEIGLDNVCFEMIQNEGTLEDLYLKLNLLV